MQSHTDRFGKSFSKYRYPWRALQHYLYADMEPAHTDRDRCVVLLGTTGNGKSTLGNFIVGKEDFRVAKKSQLVSVTVTSAESTCVHDGRQIHVIDTPGFCDTRLEQRDDTLYEIGQALLMAKDGAHAIFICVNLDSRFSDSDMASLQMIEQLGNLWSHALVVFMNAKVLGDTPEEQEREIRSMLRKPHNLPPDLNDLMKKVKQRYVLIEGSNPQGSSYHYRKVTQLLTCTDRIFSDNDNRVYTNRLFALAKRHYDAAMAQLKQERQARQDALAQFQQDSIRREETHSKVLEQLRTEMISKDQEHSRGLEQMRQQSRARDREHTRAMEQLRREQTRAQRAVGRKYTFGVARDCHHDHLASSLPVKTTATPTRSEDPQPTPSQARSRAYETMRAELKSDSWIGKAVDAGKRAGNWVKSKCSVM